MTRAEEIQLDKINSWILEMSSKLDEVIAGVDKLKEEKEYAEKALSELANEMVYRGNSVEFIYQKMTAYKGIVYEVCQAFAKLGYEGEFDNLDTLSQRLGEFADKITSDMEERGYNMAIGKPMTVQIPTASTNMSTVRMRYETYAEAVAMRKTK